MSYETEKLLGIKGNPGPRGGVLSPWALVLALCSTAVVLVALAYLDDVLPAPRDFHNTPPDQFMGEVAHRHLVNLTSIGPRVAGSYENEVLAVNTLVNALREIARQASPHNKVEVDVFAASGAFTLTFLDGMTNMYRGVQSVVGRVSGAGGDPPLQRAAKRDLLINCHFDTVPDSPGASDDGAGCAVVLETVRALAASRAPLRRPLVVLLNGAEENIMQASHAFITQHKWSRKIRAFVNVEACGAGGREVLFQAGPRDPFLLHAYAERVPHPFASSFAQDLFESGMIPADTDFRVFRDFANISGVDLAWSRNGYVYHTRLDTASAVRPHVLQRTGENILALVHGLLEHPDMDSPADGSRAPLFFDVVGLTFVCVSPTVAAVIAFIALFVVLPLKIQLNARDARKHLNISALSWWRCAAWCACAECAAACAGAASAAAAGAALHAAAARLAFYSRPLLLAPMFVLPAIAVPWITLHRMLHSKVSGAWVGVRRGWWPAVACHDGCALAAGALTALAAAARVRSGFVPALALLAPALADTAAHATPNHTRPWSRACLWVSGALLPAVQVCYLSLNTLYMSVPVLGRAGTGPLPPDVIMAILVAVLVLNACAWMLPFVVVTRKLNVLVYTMLAICIATVVGVILSRWSGDASLSYSALTPQRYMVFHTRRTLHTARAAHVAQLYWVPALDANTPHSVHNTAEECEQWVYCGAPYYLPVLSFISRGYWAPATEPPLVEVTFDARRTTLNDTTQLLQLNITGPAHLAIIVSPGPHEVLRHARAAGAGGVAPLAGPVWRARNRLTYFITLHNAHHGEGNVEHMDLFITHPANTPPAPCELSIGGHALFGAARLSPAHASLLNAFPEWVAATGWGVDLHLVTL